MTDQIADRTHKRFTVVMVMLLGMCIARADVELRFDTNRINQLNVAAEAEGVIALKTQGEDPFMLLMPFETDATTGDDRVLAFEYFCPDGINDLAVYYGPPIQVDQLLSAGEMRRAESWQPFAVDLVDASSGRWSHEFNLLRLDFGKRGGVELRIRNLRLRPPNADERASTAERERIRNRKQAAAERVIEYLAAEMPVQIESVSVNNEQIKISGQSPKLTGRALRLIEAQPWQELWKGGFPIVRLTEGGGRREEAVTSNAPENQNLLTSAAIIVLEGNRFTVIVPRFDGGRDRITSRWAVVEKRSNDLWKLVSHCTYPTDLTAACEYPGLDRKIVDGIKGMGGVWANDILDELVELGVKHITDNMWISTHFSGTERKDWIQFQHNGRDWWANPAFVNGHDRLIKFATANDMIVSAIILVGFGDDGFAGTLQHPDAVRAGQYAMPNLTTPEGVAAYEAAMHFIAKRYAQPGDPHGRISNWIMHNEVDYGWVWTNMGEQPLPVFLDTYIRSMRIVHNIARQFNPHARTFISLTHNWHKPEDPAWKTYAPKKMLEILSEFSRVEGDFEWGVAYHPYPQSLFKSDTWNDTRPTGDFDTPLITPKNLAVLDRWMQREEMLFHEEVGTDPPGGPSTIPNVPGIFNQNESRDPPNGALGELRPTTRGKVRGVMLSEQGFHTKDYSEESERLQGAAFLYMWHKMRGLKSIESFQNHRWVDHPHEGGLKLGVRTLPGDGKPYGEKKYGWEVYKALDTPDEATFAEELKEVIAPER